MTNWSNQPTLDQEFLLAYSNQLSATALSTSSSVNANAVGSGQSSVKVILSASVDVVRASFDPVSIDQDRATRVLNQTARLGYKAPNSSTR